MEVTTHPAPTRAREQLLAGIPIPERAIELAGVSTTTLEGGLGPPVILLHGPGGFSGHWGSVIPGLVTTHRVIAPDLPGHGSSIAGDGELDAERTLDWLDELIDRTCPQPPALVGHGLGGAIAARFAAERSTRIEQLVLVDTLGLDEFSPDPAFGRALEEFMADPSERTHDGLWRYCARDLEAVRGRMGATWDVFRAYNVDRARTPSVAAAVGALMAEFGLPAIPADALEAIRVPTTLIWGRADLAVPLSVAESAAESHGWALRVIEDCADDPPVEQPEALVDALRGCLEGREGR
jgi:pimeloyl-ACP methyl ester carboxylesterase